MGFWPEVGEITREHMQPLDPTHGWGPPHGGLIWAELLSGSGLFCHL